MSNIYWVLSSVFKMISNDISDYYLSLFKTMDYVPLVCQRCGGAFLKRKKEIRNHLSRGRSIFCSRSCNSRAQNEKKGFGAQQVNCEYCGAVVTRINSQLKKTKFSFCSKSCSAKWRNINKTTGFRRSKLEVFLEGKIKSTYTDLPVDFNYRTSEGFELDFLFASIKLAVEVNGIFHYQPIFGDKKLNRIIELDSKKKHYCSNMKIDLLVIENSFSSFKIIQAEEIWENLHNEINKRLWA